MSGNDQYILLKLLIPFFIFITTIICIFLFKTRKQKLPSDYFLKNTNDISIDLKPALSKRLSTNISIIKVMPFVIVFLMYLFVIGLLVVSDGPDGFKDILNPKSVLFKISFIVFALMSVGAFLAHLKLKDQVATLEKAILLAQNKSLYFKLTHEELRAPVMVLTNPAFWQATDRDLFEIIIPFRDIISLEVFAGAGKSPAQYLIKAKDNSQYLGNGAMGGFHFGFGIKREYLAKDERKILSFLLDKLGERLIIRDQFKF